VTVEWEELDRMERITASKRRRYNPYSNPDLIRSERELMRAELGDMEDE
jgi:hypothetical protein